MSYCPMKLKLFSAFPSTNADLKILLFGKRRRMEFTLLEVHIGCFQKLRPCPNQANQIQQQIMGFGRKNGAPMSLTKLNIFCGGLVAKHYLQRRICASEKSLAMMYVKAVVRK